MNTTERANDMRNFFNEKIDTYDQVHSEFLPTKKLLADNLPSDSKRILDLGCGTGLELIEVFKRFPNIQVTGIDISDKMLEELQKRPFSTNVTTICGDFFTTDFGTEYDAVISTSALHHFFEKEKLILYKKILQALKDGGYFINCDRIAISTEEEQEAIYNYNHRLSEFKHLDTPLTKENELRLLQEAGFREISSQNGNKENYLLTLAKK